MVTWWAGGSRSDRTKDMHRSSCWIRKYQTQTPRQQRIRSIKGMYPTTTDQGHGVVALLHKKTISELHVPWRCLFMAFPTNNTFLSIPHTHTIISKGVNPDPKEVMTRAKARCYHTLRERRYHTAWKAWRIHAGCSALTSEDFLSISPEVCSHWFSSDRSGPLNSNPAFSPPLNQVLASASVGIACANRALSPGRFSLELSAKILGCMQLTKGVVEGASHGKLWCFGLLHVHLVTRWRRW